MTGRRRVTDPNAWGYDPDDDDGVEPEPDDRYATPDEQDGAAADAAWGPDL